jgi:succinate-acetate transporter protein
LITCIFELLIGNTFAYTIFGALGGYFMSLGVFFTPAFGIIEHYSTLNKIPMAANAPIGTVQQYDAAKGIAEFQNALGMYNFCWAAMFIVFFIVALRTNIFMIFIFGCVSVTCICSGIAGFYKAMAYEAVSTNMGKIKITKHMLELREEHEHTAMIWDKVAGGFLFASSLPNWYLLFLILALSSGWKLRMPAGDLGAHKDAHKKVSSTTLIPWFYRFLIGRSNRRHSTRTLSIALYPLLRSRGRS